MNQMNSPLIRIGVFYDGNYFLKISDYYYFQHDRKARISLEGLHEFIRHQVAEEEDVDVRLSQIIDAHFFRGRLSATEAPFTSHRSWTHTIWAAGLWTYIGHLANQSLGWHGVALFAGGGYVSHLLADTLTKAGVKWLRPLSDICLKIPLIRTGSKSGNFLEVVICTGYALLVLVLLVSGIKF